LVDNNQITNDYEIINLMSIEGKKLYQNKIAHLVPIIWTSPKS